MSQYLEAELKALDIYGIGTDIVECARIAQVIERHGERFLARIFTHREIEYCQGKKRSTEHYAARWAAKEAIFKALGTGWRGNLNWTDFEIRHDPLGRPLVWVGGLSRDYLHSLRVANVLLTLSHCRAYATATALALQSRSIQAST